ncbi:hypothetical protein D3C87_1641700 [compost metagenome]
MHGAAHDLAQLAAVDDFACLLMGAAKEGIGGGTDLQATIVCSLLEGHALFERQHEGLFRIGVLARRDDIHRHRIVGRRNRQVHDHVDFAVLEQLVGSLRLDAEFLGALLGGGRENVGDGADLEPLEQGREAQVGTRDIAGTHDADAKGLGHVRLRSP